MVDLFILHNGNFYYQMTLMMIIDSKRVMHQGIVGWPYPPTRTRVTNSVQSEMAGEPTNQA